MAANPLKWLLGRFSLDISVDLGTSNTIVTAKGKGILINEPSWVAIHEKTRRLMVIGSKAKVMAGRTPPNVLAVRPIRDGVISDFELTRAMIEYFIAKAHENLTVPVPYPKILMGIPAGATEVERRAVYDAAMAAGAREAYLVEEPTAAALGAGLPVTEVRGSMIVDIGGGTSEMAVFTMGGVVVSRSLRVAGEEMDQAIANYVRNKLNLQISERTAERVKITIGSTSRVEEDKTIFVQGRNLLSRLPEVIYLTSAEIREALANTVGVISNSIREAVDEVPPELGADLLEFGICLAGGGSLLQGLTQKLTTDLGIPVWVTENPLGCVARGQGQILEDFDKHMRFLVGLEGRIR